MSVANDLVIFWNSDDGQEEVRGLYIYGLMKRGSLRISVDALKASWKPISVECQHSFLDSELGCVVVVAIKFDSVPSARGWLSSLNSSLTTLLDDGAIVAWAGGEDCSWSPDVLDPDSGVGNVLAAKCASTGFLCNSKFDESTEFLDDSQLASLWSIVKN